MRAIRDYVRATSGGVDGGRQPRTSACPVTPSGDSSNGAMWGPSCRWFATVAHMVRGLPATQAWDLQTLKTASSKLRPRARSFASFLTSSQVQRKRSRPAPYYAIAVTWKA